MGINLTTQLSKLEALNGMASYLGIPPLQSTSEIDQSPDFQLAELILNELVREVCAHGMPCNTEYDYKLQLDTNNEIPLESGMIVAKPEREYAKYTVEREGKLFNIEKNTFTFDNEIPCTVFWLMDYESLPQVVRNYTYVAGARRLVSRVKGDDAVLATTQLDILRAETEFLTYTENIRATNMIYDNPESYYAIDNNSANLGYEYYGY
jgi:hypothetical protein